MKKQPAMLKGLLWGLFSATATASAFLLPAFIVGQFFAAPYNHNLSPYLLYGSIVIIYFCALYHALYRIKSSDHDLHLLSTFAKACGLFMIVTILFLFIP